MAAPGTAAYDEHRQHRDRKRGKKGADIQNLTEGLKLLFAGGGALREKQASDQSMRDTQQFMLPLLAGEGNPQQGFQQMAESPQQFNPRTTQSIMTALENLQAANLSQGIQKEQLLGLQTQRGTDQFLGGSPTTLPTNPRAIQEYYQKQDKADLDYNYKQEQLGQLRDAPGMKQAEVDLEAKRYAEEREYQRQEDVKDEAHRRVTRGDSLAKSAESTRQFNVGEANKLTAADTKRQNAKEDDYVKQKETAAGNYDGVLDDLRSLMRLEPGDINDVLKITMLGNMKFRSDDEKTQSAVGTLLQQMSGPGAMESKLRAKEQAVTHYKANAYRYAKERMRAGRQGRSLSKPEAQLHRELLTNLIEGASPDWRHIRELLNKMPASAFPMEFLFDVEALISEKTTPSRGAMMGDSKLAEAEEQILTELLMVLESP